MKFIIQRLFFVVFSIILASNTYSQSEELGFNNIGKTYKNGILHFAVKYPSNWEFSDDFYQYNKYYLVYFKLPYRLDIYYKENIKIYVFETQFENEDDLYYKFYEFNSKLPSYNITRCKYGYEETSSDSDYEYKRYYLVINKVGYIISLQVNHNNLVKREEEFDKFVDKLEFF